MIYYNEDNLPNSKIESVCRELFTSTDMIKHDFYIFIRSYLNIISVIKQIVSNNLVINTELSKEFRKNVINISNYIWNTWSSKYNIEEALVSGDRESVTTLSSGDKLDKWAQIYEKGIYYQEIIEIIGKKMSKQKIKKRDKGIPIEELGELEESEELPRPTIKDTKDINKTIVDDLQNMKFTIDGQELVF